MSDEEKQKPRVPCGIYQTTQPIEGKVRASALVFYHNHGDPGPGVYPVVGWVRNKAVFAKRGFLIPEPAYAQSLKPLPPEGFYRVRDGEEVTCCEKRCRVLRADTLVQLGYNKEATPVLFEPLWTYKGLTLPPRGLRVSLEILSRLSRVKVSRRFDLDDLEDENPPSFTGSRYLH